VQRCVTFRISKPTSTPVSPVQTPTDFPSPEEVVTQFLNSISDDPTGKSSLGYLSQFLQEDLAADHSLTDLMGIQNSFVPLEFPIRSWTIAASELSSRLA